MWREFSALEGLARGERGEAMTKIVQADIGERLLTLKEAAEVLRLSTRTVREYLRNGEIRGKIIGKQWRFKRADLDAFFENAPSEWDFAGKDSDGD
jgi:excisionase family DNA binding protein